MVKMTFKIGETREVTFDFDTLNDTPESVANEMVSELELDEDQQNVIIKQIQS